jgi:RNA polymerase sigma-70 factor (ECF subfamily)
LNTNQDDLTRIQDREKFAELFDRFFTPLVRYARGITQDEDSAKDVVHDVFLKLWEKRGTIRAKASVTAMLYTMVRNRSLNTLRSMNRINREVSASDAAGAVDEREHEGDVRLGHRALQWIDELPARRREAFMLSRFHDLTHAEIARIMDVSERTVNTHILLALRSLRERLEEFEREDMTP